MTTVVSLGARQRRHNEYVYASEHPLRARGVEGEGGASDSVDAPCILHILKEEASFLVMARATFFGGDSQESGHGREGYEQQEIDRIDL